jgi:hypothetical protein
MAVFNIIFMQVDDLRILIIIIQTCINSRNGHHTFCIYIINKEITREIDLGETITLKCILEN